MTTAVSDDDDGDPSTHNSPYKAKQTSSSTASFNCTGAVRKAGFLSVKKWLLRKKHTVGSSDDFVSLELKALATVHCVLQ